jgi:uncharacterized protein YjbJ (UPF0337 family)
MTDKSVGRPMGRMKEAGAALSAAKRLENEGRADRARGAAKSAVDKVADTLSGGKANRAVAARMCVPTQLGRGR